MELPPPIDWTVLDEIKSLQDPAKPGFVRELIDLFLSETSARLAEMGRALERHDRDAIARGSHMLKGSIGTLGARRLSDLCGRLEAENRGAAWDEVAGLLRQVEAEYARVREALESER